jgi:hypothetical protein
MIAEATGATVDRAGRVQVQLEFRRSCLTGRSRYFLPVSQRQV